MLNLIQHLFLVDPEINEVSNDKKVLLWIPATTKNDIKDGEWHYHNVRTMVDSYGMTYKTNTMWQESKFLQEYLAIGVFFGIAILISALIMILPNLLANKKYNKDKLEPYECGFEPFSDARAKFDIRFYLVAILFIIFDLEVTFLIPWAITLGKIGKIGFFSMMFFLFVLIIGFIYEWKKGALEWE